MKPTAHLQGAVVLAALALGLSACSSTSSSPNSTTTTFPVAYEHQTPAPVIPTTAITIGGVTVTVPREEYNPNRPIQSTQDDGQQIVITDKGVLPQNLLAPTPTTITWTNLSSRPVNIYYSKAGTPGYSGFLKPGDHFSLSMVGSGTISYNTTNHFHGNVGVGVLPLPQITTTTTSPTG